MCIYVTSVYIMCIYVYMYCFKEVLYTHSVVLEKA